MLLATIASASMALAAPALGRSALWHDRAVVRMSTASLVQKSRYAEDEEWIQRLDLPAFGAEVRALGRRLRDEEGAADLEHFRRIRRWTRVCGAVGVATMGLPLNPLTVVALSTWTYASWTMVAHHTCHGGYDRHDAQPGQDRFHGSRFALGGVLNRGRDWLDWMLPEAWNLEHNVLHHYKLGEAGDPDLVERNLDFLRVAPLPRGLKVAYVALMAGIWKWVPDLCLIWGRIASDCSLLASDRVRWRPSSDGSTTRPTRTSSSRSPSTPRLASHCRLVSIRSRRSR